MQEKAGEGNTGGNMTKKVSMEVTLKDIYDIVQETKEHVIMTNGKVKLNKWIATTALSLVVVAIGLILNHLRA